MAHIDNVYNKMVMELLTEGFGYQDVSRGGMYMLEIPSYTLDIDMLKGFPLLTTKRVHYKSVLHELIWMLSGSTNIEYLKENVY